MRPASDSTARRRQAAQRSQRRRYQLGNDVLSCRPGRRRGFCNPIGAWEAAGGMRFRPIGAMEDIGNAPHPENRLLCQEFPVMYDLGEAMWRGFSGCQSSRMQNTSSGARCSLGAKRSVREVVHNSIFLAQKALFGKSCRHAGPTAPLRRRRVRKGSGTCCARTKKAPP